MTSAQHPGSDLPPPAVAYIDSQDRAPIEDPEVPTPHARILVVLAGIIHHQHHHPDDPIPSLTDLPAEWSGYLPDDTHAVQQLHTHRVTSVSHASPPNAFDLEDGQLLAIDARRARYTLNGGLQHARHVQALMLAALRADTPRAAIGREDLTRAVADMEVRALITCTEHLRGRPLPDAERAPYATAVRDGLDAGHTVRAMVTLIHRAVQEPRPPADALTQWLRVVHDGHVPVPERMLPPGMLLPAALPAGRGLLRELHAEDCTPHTA